MGTAKPAAETPISKGDLVVFQGEPRVLDLQVAEVLGFSRNRSIRQMIERNRAELETYGEIATRRGEPAAKGGAPSTIFFLNEGQALVVCALSRTPKAAVVRRALIDAFMAYRQGGQLTTSRREHRHHARVRFWKLRFAESVMALDALGVDAASFDMNSVKSFGRALSGAPAITRA